MYITIFLLDVKTEQKHCLRRKLIHKRQRLHISSSKRNIDKIQKVLEFEGTAKECFVFGSMYKTKEDSNQKS